VLSAATAPGTTATLDLGGGAGTSATLQRGTLNLQFANSSIRAETVTIASDSSLTGNGTIYNGVGASGTGTTTVAGTIAPGNSIGLLTVVGNYVQTGAYEVEYRPVPLGRSRGRNLVEGTAVSLAEQDADLIRVSGTATLTGGTLVPVALGSAAEFAASRAASPTGELRYLVLRAEQGLGGTRYAALSNIAVVRTEYPGNGTDVELVVSGTPVPPDGGDGDNRPVILLPSAPPPALAARDGTLRQWGLSQNATLFDLAVDCDRPSGLSGAARDEMWCGFGQGRLATASGSGGDELSVYGGAWAQSGLGRSRLNVADAAAGVMRRVGEEAWVGFALGYGQGWFDFGGGGGEAFKTSFNALQLAGLGRWAWGPLELRGMGGYGWSEVDSERPSGLRGSDTRLSADYDVRQAVLAGEARWWFGTRGDLAVAPTLRLTGARQWRGSYSEEGTSADRFTAESATWDSLRMAVGVTGEIGVTVLETPLVIEPRLGWVRELGDRAVSVTGSYAGDPGVVVTGSGGPASRDSAVAGLAGIAQLTDRTRLRRGYDGSWYDGGSSHSLTMRLSYAW
jgi:subtilase-type serine protease